MALCAAALDVEPGPRFLVAAFGTISSSAGCKDMTKARRPKQRLAQPMVQLQIATRVPHAMLRCNIFVVRIREKGPDGIPPRSARRLIEHYAAFTPPA
jgi:hypothetical protein